MDQVKSSATFYGREQLLAVGRGEMIVGSAQGKLPLPPMLMFDRISSISSEGGRYGKGRVEAELDVLPDLWFFQCHFMSDPVMPGSLGLDAMWQLLGFYLAWCGNEGLGRALGVGKLKLSGQVLPGVRKVTYVLDIKRVFRGRIAMGLADATMAADGQVVYRAKDLKAALFERRAAVIAAL